MLNKEIIRIEKEIEDLSRLSTLIPIKNAFKVQSKIVALKKELAKIKGEPR